MNVASPQSYVRGCHDASEGVEPVRRLADREGSPQRPGDDGYAAALRRRNHHYSLGILHPPGRHQPLTRRQRAIPSPVLSSHEPSYCTPARRPGPPATDHHHPPRLPSPSGSTVFPIVGLQTWTTATVTLSRKSGEGDRQFPLLTRERSGRPAPPSAPCSQFGTADGKVGYKSGVDGAPRVLGMWLSGTCGSISVDRRRSSGA